MSLEKCGKRPLPGTGEVNRSPAPAVSVVVPVRNGGMQLSRCLEALSESECTNFEVIVVDDCSTDSTRQIIERFPARYLCTPSILGPAGARNLGVRHAGGSIIVFVDADVVVPPGALKIIADEFASDPELAALFGSYDEAPTWRNFFSQFKNLMHYYVHQNSSERGATFWAGCGAIRKGVFEQMGGFDVRQYSRPSIEDIEFGYRLVRAGRKVQLNKGLKAKHLKRWSLVSLLRTDILDRAVPWTNLILETRNLPRDLNLTYKAQVSAGLVGALVLGGALLMLRAAGLLPWAGVRYAFLAELSISAILLALNWHIYGFFATKRGPWFAVKVVPMHWFYYFYGGTIFVGCSALQVMRRLFGADHRRAIARTKISAD